MAAPDKFAPDRAISSLIEAHIEPLYRFAFARVRDRALAEDLVQETLLAALRDADRFSGVSSLGTWLTGILKHKIADHYRRSGWLTDLGDDEDIFDATGHWRADSAPAVWNTPESLLENEQLGIVLRDALDNIPRPLATVFALHEIEGLTRQEICELLDLSDSNYWVMLHRARLRLRREVERRWNVARTPLPNEYKPLLQVA